MGFATSGLDVVSQSLFFWKQGVARCLGFPTSSRQFSGSLAKEREGSSEMFLMVLKGFHRGYLSGTGLWSYEGGFRIQGAIATSGF